VTQINASSSTILVDRIFRILQDSGKLGYFGELTPSLGVINAVYSAIYSLRMVGIKSEELKPEVFNNLRKGNEVKQLLRIYEGELKKKKLIDLPGLFSLAVNQIENKIDDKKYFLCFKDLPLSQVEKNFIKKIAGERLVLLPQDMFYGVRRPQRLWEQGKEEIAAPYFKDRKDVSSDLERMPWLFAPYKSPAPFKDNTIDLFHAVGKVNECREIMRKICAEKTTLDEVELVYPSASSYADIFFLLAAKTDLQITYSEGIGVGFTTPGKVFSGLLDWFEGGFKVSDLCRMIESGNLKLFHPGEKDVPSLQKISGYLRKAGIGWGRDRYITCLKNLTNQIKNDFLQAQEKKEEEKLQRLETDIKNLKKITKVIKKMLSLLPRYEDKDDKEIDFETLCAGATKFLKAFSAIRSELDGTANIALTFALNETVAMQPPPLIREEAVKRLRSQASGIKVGASKPKPGHLHLSTYKTGGYSSRENTFIVGLDQGSFPGAGLQQPVLLDDEKEKISKALQTTEESLLENIYSMAAMLASLRGRAFLSYSSYDLIEERSSFPSSLLLQAYRLLKGDSSLDYSALLYFLTEPVGFLTKNTDRALDEIDWWLAKIGEGKHFLNGLEAVHNTFPSLDRGIFARQKREGNRLSEFEGILNFKAGESHPIMFENMQVSASRLETLTYCPFKYFLHYILKVRVTDELEYDPGRWLKPWQRGELIHEIFCRFMTELVKKGEKFSEKDHMPIIQKIGEEIVLRYKNEIPPPSEGIFKVEKTEIFQAIDVFMSVEKKRKDEVEPLMFEEIFEGITPDDFSDFPLQLRGRIDRIDRVGKGKYRVIDYKTGRYTKFQNIKYFGGGEVLQHALYALAAEKIIKEKDVDKAPHVIESGYSFPTPRGEGNEVIFKEFNRKDFKAIIDEIVKIITAGHFVVNPKAKCDFCDYADICGPEAVKRTKDKMPGNPDEFRHLNKLKNYK
jgi:ATP-dependent helicase/nuclease subunit B